MKIRDQFILLFRCKWKERTWADIVEYYTLLNGKEYYVLDKQPAMIFSWKERGIYTNLFLWTILNLTKGIKTL